MNQVIVLCPIHEVLLKKKSIMYGDPDPECDHSDVILGGCVMESNSPQVGYECPEGKEAYVYLRGRLVKFEID